MGKWPANTTSPGRSELLLDKPYAPFLEAMRPHEEIGCLEMINHHFWTEISSKKERDRERNATLKIT